MKKKDTILSFLNPRKNDNDSSILSWSYTKMQVLSPTFDHHTTLQTHLIFHPSSPPAPIVFLILSSPPLLAKSAVSTMTKLDPRRRGKRLKRSMRLG